VGLPGRRPDARALREHQRSSNPGEGPTHSLKRVLFESLAKLRITGPELGAQVVPVLFDDTVDDGDGLSVMPCRSRPHIAPHNSSAFAQLDFAVISPSCGDSGSFRPHISRIICLFWGPSRAGNVMSATPLAAKLEDTGGDPGHQQLPSLLSRNAQQLATIRVGDSSRPPHFCARARR